MSIIITPAIMAEIDKIKSTLGYDAIRQCGSKTSNSIYFYLYKKKEYRVCPVYGRLKPKKNPTFGFFKIRISDHFGGRTEDANIIISNNKLCVFLDKQIIGGKI